ncbi:MAG: hypothetical protein AMXMBFR13_30810 [Phycisphaerae bacterium]
MNVSAYPFVSICVPLMAAILGAITPAASGANYLDVVISEIMYHATGTDSEGEYIEITNRGSQIADLSGWRFSDGVEYSFPGGTVLPPGGRLVIAANPATVQAFYGITGVLGPYEGRLDNNGERLELRDAQDALVGEVDYDDETPWPEGGDGDGRSIELTNLFKNHNVGRFWAPSSRIMGTPGAANGTGAAPPLTVVINEFMANPAGGQDYIELYNYGTSAVDVNNCYLTDNPKNPTKARIRSTWSAGTTIVPPGGFWVATENDFGFGLSASGEQVYLIASDGTTYIDGYDFGDQPFEGASEGRYPDGGGRWYKMPTSTRWLPNVAPPLPGVVINEIMYHPAGAAEPGAEYIELRNLNAAPVDLGGWAFTKGIDYVFPPGTMIPANGFLVIAGDPSLVATTYGISGVLGPYEGVLSNFSDEIELEDHLENRVDFVEYRQEGVWPTGPDGNGPSLEWATNLDRRLPGAWRPSNGNGTPGIPNSLFVANPAATIDRVRHAPLVPTSSQAVTVTALVGGGGLGSVTLYYKRDPEVSFSSTPMYDDGAHGDGAAGDGTYAGTIPAQLHGTTMEFYIQANATGGNTAFPASSPSANCLYIVDNSAIDSNLNIFRFVLTDERWNSLLSSPNSDNPRDCTFIYADKAYYNSGVRFRSGNRNGPKYSYKVHLTPGYTFRGADVFNLNFEKHDGTALKNKIIYHLLEYMNLPSCRSEFVHTRWRSGYGGVHLYTEAHDNDYLDNHFPEDSEGNLYKAIAAWVTSKDGRNIAWGGQHGWYEKETNEAANNWSDLDSLAQTMWPTSPNSTYEANCRAKVDVPNWCRSYAVLATACLIDTPWHLNNQNYRLYRRLSDNRFIHLLYDFDDAYWNTMYDNAGPISSNYEDVRRFLLRPAFLREYAHGIWRAVNATDGVYREERIIPEIAYYHGLIYNDVDADPFTGTGSNWNNFVNGKSTWNNWLSTRNALLRSQLSTAPLAITTNGGATIVTNTASVTLEGTAPLGAPRLEVFGSEAGIEWPSITQWRANLTMVYSTNNVVVRTLDDDGNELERVTIEIIYTGGIGDGANFITGPLPTEPPLTVQFQDQSHASNITAWDWDFGDNTIGAGPNPTHTYTSWGTYDVTLTITATGGPFSITKPITVGTPPPPVPGDFDLDNDVDMEDYGRFQACLSGSGTLQTDPTCGPAQMDIDGDVDVDDVNLFIKCLSGPNEPGDPDCRNF